VMMMMEVADYTNSNNNDTIINTNANAITTSNITTPTGIVNVGSTRLQIGGPLNALSASPDGSLIAVGGRMVYRIVRLTQEDTFQMHIPIRVGKKNMNYGVVDLKWHPSPNCANLIATAPTNGKVILWNVHSNHSVKLASQFEEHKRTVNSICWRPGHENNLLSGSQDGTVKLWDIRQATHAINFPCNGEIRCVKFSPHYKDIFAAGMDSGDVQIWDIRKPDRFSRNFASHNGLVLTLDWHPTKTSYIATGGRDRLIKVWDMRKASRPAFTVQTIASVSTILWRPHYDHHIISCANVVDSAAHLWDLNSKYVPLLTFKGHDDVITGMLWHRDSPDQLITCSKDGNLMIQSSVDAIYPRAKLRTTALSFNIHNELAFLSERIDRKQHERFCQFQAQLRSQASQQQQAIQPSNLQQTVSQQTLPPQSQSPMQPTSSTVTETAERFKFVENKINAEMLILNCLDNEIEESSTLGHIKYFAMNYKLFEGTIQERCEHNAKVAAHIKKHHIEKVWRFLQVAYASMEEETCRWFKKNSIREQQNLSLQMDESFENEHISEASEDVNDTETENEDEEEDEDLDHITVRSENNTTLDIYTGFFEQTPTDTFMPPPVTDLSALPFSNSLSSPPISSSDSLDNSNIELIHRQADRGVYAPIFSSSDITPSSPVVNISSDVTLEAAASFKNLVEAADVEKVVSRHERMDHINNRNINGLTINATSSNNRLPAQQRHLPPPTFHFVSESTVSGDLTQQQGINTNFHNSKTAANAGLSPQELNISADGDKSFSNGQKNDQSRFDFSPIVYQILDYYSEYGDPQTCVAIIAVLGKDIKLEKQRVLEWYLSYIELLTRLKLFTYASDLINGSSESYINNMNKQSTSIRISCGKCGSVLQKGTVCDNCKSRTNICTICHLPVFGCYFWCQKCGHGGHMDHMINWFKKYGYCPACSAKADVVQRITI